MRKGGKDYPNAYAISKDSGETWTPTRAAGILGISIKTLHNKLNRYGT